MPKSLQQLSVLVVDDDRDICEFMETLLTQDGFAVSTVSDPTVVPDMVREGGYHMIVLDLMMPGMDGVELLKRIRKIDSDAAVVIFTGYPSLDTAVASMKLDVVDYLSKPFDPAQFRDVVDRVMRKKGLTRSPEERLQQTIGESIRASRKERGLTLKQMARRTGLSVSLLSQIERAESNASISSLYKIARALDVRTSELFGGY